MVLSFLFIATKDIVYMFFGINMCNLNNIWSFFFSNLYTCYIFSVAVMTRAYPDIYGERHEMLLLRDIASYMLLACGFIYVLSVRQNEIYLYISLFLCP